MANDVDDFWQQLIYANEEATKVLAPTWNASESVFMDVRPDVATIGQTINVVFPTDPSASVSDIGVGDISLTDIDYSTVPLVFNKHPAYAFVVRDFEQFNSPKSIRDGFLDGAIKAIKNHMNAAITALFTTGNFTTNAIITGNTSGLITVAKALQGVGVLADQKVPVTDSANMSLLLPAVPYYAMVGADTWSTAQLVGDARASDIHNSGVMPTSYGFAIKMDQQMPTTGSGTSHSYTGALIHKWAVGVVSRALPPPDSTRWMYGDLNGMSYRIQMDYNLYPKLGYIVAIDAGYGLGVLRENMGQLFTITQ